MANIVTVNVTQQIAPSPNNLQQMGAIVSQGATTLTPGTYQQITGNAGLTSILKNALPLSALSYASGLATATTTAPHGYTIGDTIPAVISGATPVGWNYIGTITVTTTTQFTYPVGSAPGSATVFGSVAPEDAGEVVTQVSTFFAQGSSIAPYVLELGPGNVTDGVAALTSFINSSAQIFYRYLVPREWAAGTTLSSYLASFAAPTAMTYFHVTVGLSSYSNFANLKAAICTLEAPTIPATEFTAAAAFYAYLNYNPGPANRLTSANNAYLYGVTPYPTFGNQALLNTLYTANVDVVGTASQGGISSTILVGGKTMDGFAISYWYGSDWFVINLTLNLSNEIVNGANNALNPLWYDQPGVNRLQARAQQTCNTGIAYGIALGPALVTAVPFYTYTQQNPSAYKAGSYNGLAATVVMREPFVSIVFNLQISTFPSGGP